MLVLVTAGCHGKPSLIGEWSTHADIGTGTLIFRDDCSFRAIRETPLMTLSLDGTYEVKGENLRLHIVKWSVPKGPKMSQADQDAMNKAFQTDALSTVSWTDDGHIKMSGAGGELTTAERVSK
jgi:hypothetical protein